MFLPIKNIEDLSVIPSARASIEDIETLLGRKMSQIEERIYNRDERLGAKPFPEREILRSLFLVGKEKLNFTPKEIEYISRISPDIYVTCESDAQKIFEELKVQHFPYVYACASANAETVRKLKELLPELITEIPDEVPAAYAQAQKRYDENVDELLGEFPSFED